MVSNPVAKFPVDVTIFEDRGGTPVQLHDKARRIVNTDDGSVEYQLKKRKFKLKPQDYGNMVIDMTKKRTHLYLWSTDPMTYIPCKVTKGNIEPVNEDARQWLVSRYRNAVNRWMSQGTWEKYLPLMTILFLIVGGAILFTVIGQQMTEVSQTNVGISSQNSKILDNIIEYGRVCGARDVPPPSVPTTDPPI